jgi:hypothetical protein
MRKAKRPSVTVMRSPSATASPISEGGAWADLPEAIGRGPGSNLAGNRKYLQADHIQRWDATLGLLAAVSLGVGGADEPDAFEFGPLLQFGEKRSLILNAIFEKTFGDNREEGVGFEYAAQVKFPLAGNVSFGAEAFGEIEDITNAPSFDETELRVGPALFFASAMMMTTTPRAAMTTTIRA